MDNTFDIQVLPDGKIRVTAAGGFSREVHADADALLEMIKNLAGGEVETKQLKPNLADPHSQQHGHNHGHKH